jgi:sulfite oxidase
VTYGIGVYDITNFIPEHPGARDNIMLAAGSALEPFWHTYQFHQQSKIQNMLEKYRIGNLKVEDRVNTKGQANPYENEPERNSQLIVRSSTPFNAEPPLNFLVENFITPVEYFYVRNHLPTPEIDISSYELEVEIESSGLKKTFTMKELKKFKKEGVVAVIMCGGNRRSEMSAIKEVRGLSWSSGAAGNAIWEGVRLCDFLAALGVKSDETSHVILEGYDRDPTYTPYAASIPLSKAMDPRGDVILAYEMNGEELSRDHGYPLRCIVPGVMGGRNVKWLGKIKISKNECNSHWQQTDYKAFSPSTGWDNVDFKTAPAIQNMPVTSAICSPNPMDHEVKIIDDHLEVKGYAYSGGGNKIIRVDVTCDRGQTWITADLEQLQDGELVSAGRHYAWTLWTAHVPVRKDQNYVEIWSKAVDSNYNCQPETFRNTWNLRGVVANAYSRVGIRLN